MVSGERPAGALEAPNMLVRRIPEEEEDIIF